MDLPSELKGGHRAVLAAHGMAAANRPTRAERADSHRIADVQCRHPFFQSFTRQVLGRHWQVAKSPLSVATLNPLKVTNIQSLRSSC